MRRPHDIRAVRRNVGGTSHAGGGLTTPQILCSPTRCPAAPAGAVLPAGQRVPVCLPRSDLPGPRGRCVDSGYRSVPGVQSSAGSPTSRPWQSDSGR